VCSRSSWRSQNWAEYPLFFEVFNHGQRKAGAVLGVVQHVRRDSCPAISLSVSVNTVESCAAVAMTASPIPGTKG